MRYNKFLSLLAVVAVSAAASAQSFSIRVNVGGMTDSVKVVISDDENPNGKALGSAAAPSGNVTVEGNTRMSRLATANIFTKTPKGKWGRDAVLRLMVDTTDISIAIDKAVLDGNLRYKQKETLATISAGQANEAYQKFLDYMRLAELHADSLSYVAAEAWFANNGDEVKIAPQREASDKAKAEVDDMTLRYISLNPQSPVAAALVAQRIYSPFTYSTIQVDKWMSLLANNPDTAHVNFLRRNLAAIKAQAIGTPFTDFTATTPEGTSVQLSSLMQEGKLTLIDFWASWCGPCRKAIPQVKAMLDKHNDRLTVISCSLDEKEPAWRKAMEDEKMPWAQLLVSQQTFSDTVAQAYMISSIPCLVLIGTDGNIVKVTHKPEEILKTLEQQ
ncbi:MAG: TlpA family protein disulfide reductase [Prevotella sp.]